MKFSKFLFIIIFLIKIGLFIEYNQVYDSDLYAYTTAIIYSPNSDSFFGVMFDHIINFVFSIDFKSLESVLKVVGYY